MTDTLLIKACDIYDSLTPGSARADRLRVDHPEKDTIYFKDDENMLIYLLEEIEHTVDLIFYQEA